MKKVRVQVYVCACIYHSSHTTHNHTQLQHTEHCLPAHACCLQSASQLPQLCCHLALPPPTITLNARCCICFLSLLPLSICFYPNKNTVIETELTRQADSRVRSVFLDPSGTHSIVCLRTASSTEVQYVHSSWTKPRVLGKLKGLQLSAVGWQKQAGGAAGAEDGSDDALLQFVTG